MSFFTAEKAKTMFEEMDLQWDLDEYLKLCRKSSLKYIIDFETRGHHIISRIVGLSVID